MKRCTIGHNLALITLQASAAVTLSTTAIASPSGGPDAVLPRDVEVQLRHVQRAAAQQLPPSWLSRANIAIHPTRIDFLDPGTDGVLLSLVQSAEPPWFSLRNSKIPLANEQLLLDLLKQGRYASPWRDSNTVTSAIPRDDWTGEPMRTRWQLWLAGAVIWLALLRIVRVATAPTR